MIPHSRSGYLRVCKVKRGSLDMAHTFSLRVYYEDTDFGGIVYYANYLKFIERARSEWVRSLGLDQKTLKSERGVVFVVRHLEADYISPAKFDDILEVVTDVHLSSAARLVLNQEVLRGNDVLFRARVTLIAMRDTGKPTRLPAEIRLRQM
jgi:acyl-CoA thioester hydrolase